MAVTLIGISWILKTILTYILVKTILEDFVQHPSFIIIQKFHVISLTPLNVRVEAPLVSTQAARNG